VGVGLSVVRKMTNLAMTVRREIEQRLRSVRVELRATRQAMAAGSA
jgi:hypothetical protein